METKDVTLLAIMMTLGALVEVITMIGENHAAALLQEGKAIPNGPAEFDAATDRFSKGIQEITL